MDRPSPPLSLSASASDAGDSPTGTPATSAEDKPRRPRKPKLSPDERGARSALILQAKLANKRIEEIQEEFRLSRSSVYRALDLAKRSGYLDHARDFLTLNLVPLALHAYEEALLFGDIPTKVDVANRLLDGLGVTGKHATLKVETSPAQESFEEFRAHVIRRVVAPAAPTDPPTERPDLVVEAVPGDPPPGSPASLEAHREDGLPEPRSGDRGDD